MQNPDWVTINLAEMTSIVVNHITRTKATTNCQCQTECCHLTIQVDVQSVEILPIMMVSHVLLRNINARHATNLDTSPVNVSKGGNIHNTKLDNPKLIKYTDNPYNDPDSYPSDISSSEDSFCLQVRIRKQLNGKQQIPKLTHLITNIVYWLKQHHTRNQYLRARIDTGAEVNLMPVSVYRLIYHDQDLKKLTPCKLKIGTYTMDTIKTIGTATIYLLHPDSKKLVEMTFYIASNEGSILLSCNTSLTLGLIQSRPRLDYLPHRVRLITSNVDHPRKMKEQIQVQKQVITKQPDQCHNTQSTTLPKLITDQCQILQEYPDVFEGIGKFPGPPYHIHVDPGVTPKQTPCRPFPIHLKDGFQQEISKMLQGGILVPVTQATPWINSFILVKSTDSQGQAKLQICLDPTNLTKAVTREPYHFCTPEDISHMLADACILTICDCKKGYWHQMLDEASSYLTMFNTEIGGYRFQSCHSV